MTDPKKLVAALEAGSRKNKRLLAVEEFPKVKEFVDLCVDSIRAGHPITNRMIHDVLVREYGYPYTVSTVRKYILDRHGTREEILAKSRS